MNGAAGELYVTLVTLLRGALTFHLEIHFLHMRNDLQSAAVTNGIQTKNSHTHTWRFPSSCVGNAEDLG